MDRTVQMNNSVNKNVILEEERKEPFEDTRCQISDSDTKNSHDMAALPLLPSALPIQSAPATVASLPLHNIPPESTNERQKSIQVQNVGSSITSSFPYNINHNTHSSDNTNNLLFNTSSDYNNDKITINTSSSSAVLDNSPGSSTDDADKHSMKANNDNTSNTTNYSYSAYKYRGHPLSRKGTANSNCSTTNSNCSTTNSNCSAALDEKPQQQQRYIQYTNADEISNADSDINLTSSVNTVNKDAADYPSASPPSVHSHANSSKINT